MITNSLTIGKEAEQNTRPVKREMITRRVNRTTAYNVQIIWLDKNININNASHLAFIDQLRRVAYTVNTFLDVDLCIDFLTDICNENVVMIISDELSRSVVPLIHDVIHLTSISILCKNKTMHEQWIERWSKIEGIFTEFSTLSQSLEAVVQQYEQNATSISFVPTSDTLSGDNLNQSFMYTRILKEIFLTIHFGDEHIRQYADYCRKLFVANQRQLEMINKFEHEYLKKTPIWWYTYEGFLYSILNRALRIMDIDIALKIGFFVHDLHQHIQQLHSEQSRSKHVPEKFMVYRGQGLSKNDFDRMMKAKDGLISFNNFLSTSKDRDVSLAYAESNQTNPDLFGILFVMTIDASISSTPFALIDDVSCFKTEQEILFSMHTIFRICKIKQIGDNNRLWEVELSLTSDDDRELLAVTKCLREETASSTGWDRLGRLLLKLGQPNKALQIYEVIHQQGSADDILLGIFDLIGVSHAKQGQYKEAIESFKKACDLNQKYLPANHPNTATSYSNLSNVYSDLGEYSNALLYNRKGLEIWQNILPPTHPNLALSYNNLAQIYRQMGDHLKAILFYEKSIEINEKILPANHPDLAYAYHNIGTLYSSISEYSRAFFFHQKALKISERILPSDHPDSAVFYDSMGQLYRSMGDCSKALTFHQKALEIRQKLQPPNYSGLATSYGNLGSVYEILGDYAEALLFYEKSFEIHQKDIPASSLSLANDYNNIALIYENTGEYMKALGFFEKSMEIRQKTLPPDHLDQASSYNNIGNVHQKMGQYSKALLCHEKALQIRQNVHPPNYRDLAFSYNNIGTVFSEIDNHAKALTFHEKALEIRQKYLPQDHPDLITSYMNIGVSYNEMHEYSKALSFLEKGLKIWQKIFPPDHPDGARFYTNIGSVYSNMGDYWKAFSFLERAFEMGQRSLPFNHPNLQVYKKNLETIKKKL